MVDYLKLMKVASERTFDTFKIEKLKNLQWEVQEKLDDGQDVVFIQAPECQKPNKVNKERDKPKHQAQERKRSVKFMFEGK